MYYLMGLKWNLTNVGVLSYKHLDGRKPIGFSELKSGYLEYIKSVQPTLPISISSSLVEFVDDLEMEKTLLSFFIQKIKKTESDSIVTDVTEASISDGFKNYDLYRKQRVLDGMKNALLEIKTKEEKLHQLISLVINKIFSFPILGRGGGSTSTALGVIWANAPLHWDEIDHFELLIHEFTHNLYFLDEAAHRHYCDYKRLEAKENFAVSAILKIPRRLDRVMHSLVVGTEILLLRENLIGHSHKFKAHPESKNLVINNLSTIETIYQIKNLSEIMTERNLGILNRCKEVNLNFSENIIASSKE
ncbi:MAG: aKG-HExxH-type peptide beta-hydroxylase [Bdellovibrionia bacterium]